VVILPMLAANFAFCFLLHSSRANAPRLLARSPKIAAMLANNLNAVNWPSFSTALLANDEDIAVANPAGFWRWLKYEAS